MARSLHQGHPLPKLSPHNLLRKVAWIHDCILSVTDRGDYWGWADKLKDWNPRTLRGPFPLTHNSMYNVNQAHTSYGEFYPDTLLPALLLGSAPSSPLQTQPQSTWRSLVAAYPNSRLVMEQFHLGLKLIPPTGRQFSVRLHQSSTASDLEHLILSDCSRAHTQVVIKCPSCLWRNIPNSRLTYKLLIVTHTFLSKLALLARLHMLKNKLQNACSWETCQQKTCAFMQPSPWSHLPPSTSAYSQCPRSPES